MLRGLTKCPPNTLGNVTCSHRITGVPGSHVQPWYATEFTHCITTVHHNQSRVEYVAHPYVGTFWTVSLPSPVQGNSSIPPIPERVTKETSERSADDVCDKNPDRGNDDLQKIIQHVSGRLDKGQRLFDTNETAFLAKGIKMYDEFLVYALKY